MAFLTRERPRHCPVEGCSGKGEATRNAMRVHFWHMHVQDTVVILEEGDLPHPRCPLCDMLVPWWSLNVSHNVTAQCEKGTEQKQWQLLDQEARVATSREFSAYRHPLEVVTSFKYSRRVL